MMNKVLILVFLLSALAIEQAYSHSYVTSPTSRSDQRSTQTGCRGAGCMGPCDAPSSAARSPIRIQRGDGITVNWPRNNHAAGFIRWAWAKTAESDSHAAFDNNVQGYSCHETGKVAGGACAPSNANLPNGGDSGPPDGSTGACSRSLSVPAHLGDGRWTLQWAWFGGAFNLGDYYSCVDYEIVGGNAAAKQPAFFDGGDFMNPTATGANGKCKFYNTRKLHTCTVEPCFNGEEPGQGAGRPAAFDNGGAAPAPSTPAPATPAPATPAPATPAPATPAPQTPAPPASSPAPVAGSVVCSLGSNCPDFTVSTVVTDKWGTGMTGAVRATARRSMSAWEMSFRVPAGLRVSGVWNSKLVGTSVNSDGSGTVTIRNPSWQTSVAAGQLLDIGFTASFAKGNPVANSNGFAYASGAEEADAAAADANAASGASDKKKGLDTGAIVGIAVGGAAGVAALLAGALIARKKLQRRPANTPGQEDIQFSNVVQESPSINTN